MVTSVENAIRHVRICSEIERFGEAQKSVVARLLIVDDRAMELILEALQEIRASAGNQSLAINARIARAEELTSASRLLKSTMVARLTAKPPENVFTLRPIKLPIVEAPAKLTPVLWAKKPAAVNKSKKVVELFVGA